MRVYAALALAFLIGCTSRGPAPDIYKPLATAGEDLAAAKAHVEGARRLVEGAKPHADDTGRALLDAANLEHGAATVCAGKAQVDLAEARAAADRMGKALADAGAKLEALSGRWYVVWGKRIELALWAIGVSWLVAGVLSVVLGMGNPLGWGARLGKEIIRILPGMNIFAWIRDYFASKREAT